MKKMQRRRDANKEKKKLRLWLHSIGPAAAGDSNVIN